MRTIDLIFNGSTVSGWDGQHVWLTIIIMVVAVIVVIFTGLQIGKDIPIFFIVLDMLFFIGALICVFAASHFSTMIISSPLEKNAENYEVIQEWAQDKYVLDLTEKQADGLYKYRLISDGELYVSPSTEIIVSYYGENTLVRLIQLDGEWTVFSNGQELQTVEGKVK